MLILNEMIFFYNEKGETKNDGGLDIILGNPPYVQKNAFNKNQKTNA